MTLMNLNRFRGLASSLQKVWATMSHPFHHKGFSAATGTLNKQVGGDSDFPVPHDITGCASCALAGNNAQCPFTVVIRQTIRLRALTSPASHSSGLVIGDLIPLLRLGPSLLAEHISRTCYELSRGGPLSLHGYPATAAGYSMRSPAQASEPRAPAETHSKMRAVAPRFTTLTMFARA